MNWQAAKKKGDMLKAVHADSGEMIEPYPGFETSYKYACGCGIATKIDRMTDKLVTCSACAASSLPAGSTLIVEDKHGVTHLASMGMRWVRCGRDTYWGMILRPPGTEITCQKCKGWRTG